MKTFFSFIPAHRVEHSLTKAATHSACIPNAQITAATVFTLNSLMRSPTFGSSWGMEGFMSVSLQQLIDLSRESASTLVREWEQIEGDTAEALLTFFIPMTNADIFADIIDTNNRNLTILDVSVDSLTMGVAASGAAIFNKMTADTTRKHDGQVENYCVIDNEMVSVYKIIEATWGEPGSIPTTDGAVLITPVFSRPKIESDEALFYSEPLSTAISKLVTLRLHATRARSMSTELTAQLVATLYSKACDSTIAPVSSHTYIMRTDKSERIFFVHNRETNDPEVRVSVCGDSNYDTITTI